MAKAKRICEFCGKEFEIWSSELKRKGRGRFCSKTCYDDSRRVKVVCELCGKEFTAKQSIVAKGKVRFCSKECKDESQRNKVRRVCDFCGKEFEAVPSHVKRGEGKFCSRKCYGGNRKKVVRTCRFCGKEFEAIPFDVARGGGKFCSAACKYARWAGKYSASWKGGVSFEPYPSSFNGAFKKMIRERDNHTCVLCGESGARCVHHINYDKADTSPVNCVTLCRSCHGRTGKDRNHWTRRFKQLQSERSIERYV